MSSYKNKKVFSPYNSIVAKIEEASGIKRINMRELGSELGVTVSAVSDFSKKDYIPSGTMMRWCERRKVSVDWVLNNEPEAVDGGQNMKELVESKDKIIALLEDKIVYLEGQLAIKERPRQSGINEG